MGITGTFEGYTSSPLYLFNNGKWSNLQTTGFTTLASSGGNIAEGTEINLYCSAVGNKYATFRLNQSVSLTNYNYIKIYGKFNAYLNTNTIKMGVSTNANLASSNPSLSSTISTNNCNNSYMTQIISVSSLSGNYYLYLCIVNGPSGTSGKYVDIYINKLFLSTT